MKVTDIFPYLVLFGKITALPREINPLTSRQLQALEGSTALNKISARDGPSKDSANELIDGPCRSVTMLFAKGTGEKGNLGSGDSPGPAFSDELKKSLGKNNVAAQGIDYNANVVGFLVGGDINGTKEFVEMAKKAVSKCPDTDLVFGGYSQGAQVVHKAAEKLPSEVSSKIKAAVLFGDPFFGKDVDNIPKSSVLSICNDDDIICHSGIGIEGHLNYPERAKEAADFVKSKIKSTDSRK